MSNSCVGKGLPLIWREGSVLLWGGQKIKEDWPVAERERERGGYNWKPPPRLTKQSKNGRLWSIQFFLSFYIFLIPHRSAGRCFIFSYSLSLRHLPPHLFLHLPGVQFLIFMSEIEGKEGNFVFPIFFALSFSLFTLPSSLFTKPYHSCQSLLCISHQNAARQVIIPHPTPLSVSKVWWLMILDDFFFKDN